MKKEFSIYLDLVRFIAAFFVVLFHSNVRIVSKALIPFSTYGHDAVVVFFVLSGYVIAYVTQNKENTPVEYWSSRLSRFYSIALPTVLLTPLFDLAGEAMAPRFYVDATTHDWWGLRIVSSLLFANELWNVSIMSFSNTPYWSLCYEMWYYVMFAVVTFMRGRTRFFTLILTLLFIGPKIAILAPIWWLGVVLFQWQRLYRLSAWQNWSLFLGSILTYALFHSFQISELGSLWLRELIGPYWHKQATFSRFFITDYCLGLIIAANFVGFRGIAHCFAAPLLACERVIRWVAGFTFSLYLLHQPLLQFFSALIDGDPSKPWFYLEVLAATLFGVVVISTLTEQKRRYLRDFVKSALHNWSKQRWMRRHRSTAQNVTPEASDLTP